MESTILVLTYCSLLAVSAMGFVLDRKAEMTLQPSRNSNETNGNNDSGHLAGERHERSTATCREPDKNELKAMLSNMMANPEISHDTLGETYTAGENECETVRGEEIWYRKPLKRRASCPWTIKTNVNGTRYPRKIQYAECICTDCNGGSCIPIMEPRRVLYRTQCVDGVYQYTLSTVEVSVACVCSRYSTS